jgi:hypothetical protein
MRRCTVRAMLEHVRGRRVMAWLADLDLMDPAVQPEWYPASRRPGVALRAPWSLHIGFTRA